MNKELIILLIIIGVKLVLTYALLNLFKWHKQKKAEKDRPKTVLDYCKLLKEPNNRRERRALIRELLKIARAFRSIRRFFLGRVKRIKAVNKNYFKVDYPRYMDDVYFGILN